MSVEASLAGRIVVGLSATLSAGAPELSASGASNATTTMDKTYTITKSKSSTVNSAKLIAAAVNSQAITFNGQGQIEPANQSLTFTVSKHNSAAVVNWSVSAIGGSPLTPITNYLNATSGDSVKMTAAQFNAARGSSGGVTLTATLSDGTTLVEKISVLGLRSSVHNDAAPAASPPVNTPPGVTAPPSTPATVSAPASTTETSQYVGVLTNETHIIATDAQGNGGSFTDAGGTLRIFDGTSDVTTTKNIRYSVANVSTGLTITVDENTGVYSVTALTADTGTATIRATYDASAVNGGGSIPSDGVGGSTDGTGGAGGAGGGAGGSSTSAAAAAAAAEEFETCRAKYGVTDDEATATENEGVEHPYGTSPEGLARERAVNAGRSADADPTSATSNDATATPIGCEGCENATDSFKLSPRFTLANLSSHTIVSHYNVGNGGTCVDPTTGQARRYGRAEIICNLRHLAVNALEPIFTHFEKLGYSIQISSGYRVGGSNSHSDHLKGSAADLIINYKGARIGGRHLTRVQMAIDQILRIPYTQMIFETPSSNGDILHIACRRVGGNSSLRNCWSSGNGNSGSTKAGYKFNVGIDDGPPVK